MSNPAPNPQPAVSAERVQAEIRSRFNPLPDLDGARLTSYLTEYRSGYLRNLALTMQAIEETDDTLASVIPKTKSAACRHGYEILTVDTEDEAQATAAAEQKEALEYFYNELRVTSALDRDAAGGVRLLLTQMMDAKGKGYAAHNLVWKPRPGGAYTVEATFTPLWFFEARTGQLRFLATANAYDGTDLEPGAWLVTKSTGVPLLIPSAIAYLYKNLPKQDWLVYSARHGMPILEAVVPDNIVEGSAEWDLAEAAITAASTGQLAWVRNASTTINAIQIGAQGPLPYPDLIERMDRALASIWRGGDLSTMAKGGQAVGSNAQETEADAIAADDAEWLSETLRLKLDRLVLDYVFGPETPALAYIQVLSAPQDNSAADLKTDDFLLKSGFPLSVKAASERYRRPLPDDGDELLSAPASAQGTGDRGQETGGTPAAGNTDPFTHHASRITSPLPAANTLAASLGVPLAWLAPVRAELAAMVRAAENDRMSEADLVQFLRHATDRLPELFDRMDIGGLADALEGSLGNAALEGVRASLRTKAGNRTATPAQNASLQSRAMPKFQSDDANGVKTPPNAPAGTQRVAAQNTDGFVTIDGHVVFVGPENDRTDPKNAASSKPVAKTQESKGVAGGQWPTGEAGMPVHEIRARLKGAHGLNRKEADDHIFEVTKQTAASMTLHPPALVETIRTSAAEKFKDRKPAAKPPPEPEKATVIKSGKEAAHELFASGKFGPTFGYEKQTTRLRESPWGVEYVKQGRPNAEFDAAWFADKAGMKARGWSVYEDDGGWVAKHSVKVGDAVIYDKPHLVK